MRRNRRAYAVWSLATLGYVAGSVAFPILVGYAIAAVAAQLGPAEVARRCAWLAGVALVRSVFRYFSRTLVFNAAREIEYEIRDDLFAHLQRLPQSFYQHWRTGDLMSRAVNDLNSVRLLLGPGILNMFQTPLLYAAVLTTMFVLQPTLTLLVIVPYPAFIWIARGFGRSLHAANLRVQEGLGELSNSLQEIVSGMGVVKAYAMEPVATARLDDATESLYRRQLRLARVSGAMPAITSLLPAAAMWIVLWVGGHEILQGRMNVADFFTFATYIFELTFPTFLMGWVVTLVQRGFAGMQRIDAVLATEPSIADRPDRVPLERLRGEIEFRNLTFRYPGAGREPALVDVNLFVPAGSSLGVVGPVGSGKSTLASLVPRLFEVDDGRLFFDGVDANRVPLRTLRRSVAMVPQESFLFSMTLGENIAYGLPSAEPAAVRAAAERADLAKDVRELPHGFDTLVGERGVMLSGGQRQRAALARALALHPSILILDDALSSVDAETEAEIQQHLREAFRGRTVIVISHRIASVSEADQIVVLDEGRIVEHGSHADLLAAGGLYSRLAREQALEEELARAGEAP